ncbi:arsenate reductase/protein-tyrosine-phosphatase family protein [Acuticoccus sediminis]|uniref:arsenate reductase/protein-tyrosine-phosphatase family protein n=1 Tax=Acuticoccus sediminis TaxID=2184697 RepID=UPI003850A8A3
MRPSEIAEALDLKANTLSVYVTTLTRAGILTTWREGRSVYYGIDLKRVGTLVDFLVNDCCRGRPELCEPLAARSLQRLAAHRDVGTRNVLFVCSGNSARSQFAEAILNRDGNGRFRAYSAGTKPNRRLNPEAVSVLTAHGHDTVGLKPKAIASFERPGAPVMDYVITVCDQAANEDCPPLPGLPLTAHWGIARPSAVEGNDRAAAFAAAYDAIAERLERFMALPVETLNALSLQNELDAIGAARVSGKGA